MAELDARILDAMYAAIEKMKRDPEEAARRRTLEHAKLQRMVAYADSRACLRATILRYFGHPAAPYACGTCGNCERRQPIDERARMLVRKILSGIARAGWPRSAFARATAW